MSTNVLSTISLVLAATALVKSYSSEYWDRHQDLMRRFVEQHAQSLRRLRYDTKVSWPVIAYFVFKHQRAGNIKKILYGHYHGGYVFQLTQAGRQNFQEMADAV